MKEVKPDLPFSITGIILSGGKSSRMGREKGLIKINGITLIEIAVKTLIGICNPIMAIANDDAYKQYGLPVYPDIVREQGPAGGLLTGLHYAKTDWNLLIACDIPNVTPALLQYLLKHIDPEMIAVVPEINGQAQPLCAVYHKKFYDVLQKSMKEGILSMRDILRQNKTKYLPVTEDLPFYADDLFENLNTQEDVFGFSKKGKK